MTMYRNFKVRVPLEITAIPVNLSSFGAESGTIVDEKI